MHWVAAVSAEWYERERLYQHDTVELPAWPAAVGDDVVLVAPGADGPVVFGLGRVSGAAERVLVEYVRHLDEAVPADGAGCGRQAERATTGAVPLAGEEYTTLVKRLAPETRRRDWMVSLDLPIEATSRAEAVRVFWTYVRQLGPAELPAFVWPRGDELAMRPYVLGAEHEMDPEEED